MTGTSSRADSPATSTGRSWKLFALWMLAWEAAIPIRFLGTIVDLQSRPGAAGPMLMNLVLDQTSWGLATYVMFRLALRARHQPMKRVLTILAVVAVPIIVVRFYATVLIGLALGRSAPPVGRALVFNGPFYLFLLIAAAALGLLVVYMQRERDGAVLQANLKAELASARLQTLRLQLNPHFLFNALNSIASLVPSDTAKADTAISALSSFLRASLSVTRGEETTLENELRLVDSYLEIEVLRFEWLTVDLDVPDSLRSACVPAFVLQLLVENAIRHGLAPRHSPGRVVIAARLDDDRLELSVSDDGVGISERSNNSSLGIGLQNVRARLAQLHPDDGTFTIEPAHPQGTVARIRIPYRVCQTESPTNTVDA